MTASPGNAPDARPRPRSGDVIAGKYRVLWELGAGGMGVVVAAETLDVDARERVAIKFLLPELAGSAAAVARFDREARAIGNLTSEHAVRLRDVGEHEGSPFMVMEFLVGADLA